MKKISLAATAKANQWPLADLLAAAAEFRIGPGTEFAPEAGGAVYRCAKTGLKVTRAIEAAGPGAAVVRTRLENTGAAASPPLNLLEPLFLRFDHPWPAWRRITANGGTTEEYYPPFAYATTDRCGAAAFRIESHAAGRSSNLHLPVLIALASQEPSAEGYFCAPEWSGEWYIHCDVAPEGKSQTAVGVKVNGLVLEPGEALELPPVHVGFFKGGPDGGTNAVRRYLYERVCARYHGRPMIPWVSYDHWFGIDNRLSHDLLKKEADRAAELGVEVFVVDAAWFPGYFPDGVGNWHSVNTERFPNGLEPLAEHVRALGMGFGLWFEPERAVADTEAVARHPELFVEIPSWGRKPFYHINLARRDAQDYLIETVGEWIRRLDLRWSRWDYNTEPKPYWDKVDPTGKIQFAYMEGLYRVLDTLLERHPDWSIEGCASGGRRIDAGTMRRAHTYWFSDQTTDPRLCRFMQARANRFLPGHLCNSSVGVNLGQGDAGFDDTAVLSRMLGKLAFDGDIASWSPKLTRRMARFVLAFKEVRHLFVQDFFQLLPMPATVEDWDAVQFAGYDGSEAALFVFAGCAGGEQTVRLKGLSARKRYAVRREPGGRPATRSGASLMADGLAIKLGAGQSGLWRIG